MTLSRYVPISWQSLIDTSKASSYRRPNEARQGPTATLGRSFLDDAGGSDIIAKLRHYFLVASLHAGRQYTLRVEEELNPCKRTVTVRWSRALLLNIPQIASRVYKKERSESRAYDRHNRQLSRGRRNGKTHIADCGSDHFGKFCTDDEFPKVCGYCNTKRADRFILHMA